MLDLDKVSVIVSSVGTLDPAHNKSSVSPHFLKMQARLKDALIFPATSSHTAPALVVKPPLPKVAQAQASFPHASNQLKAKAADLSSTAAKSAAHFTQTQDFSFAGSGISGTGAGSRVTALRAVLGAKIPMSKPKAEDVFKGSCVGTVSHKVNVVKRPEINSAPPVKTTPHFSVEVKEPDFLLAKQALSSLFAARSPKITPPRSSNAPSLKNDFVAVKAGLSEDDLKGAEFSKTKFSDMKNLIGAQLKGKASVVRAAPSPFLPLPPLPTGLVPPPLAKKEPLSTQKKSVPVASHFSVEVKEPDFVAAKQVLNALFAGRSPKAQLPEEKFSKTKFSEMKNLIGAQLGEKASVVRAAPRPFLPLPPLPTGSVLPPPAKKEPLSTLPTDSGAKSMSTTESEVKETEEKISKINLVLEDKDVTENAILNEILDVDGAEDSQEWAITKGIKLVGRAVISFFTIHIPQFFKRLKERLCCCGPFQAPDEKQETVSKSILEEETPTGDEETQRADLPLTRSQALEEIAAQVKQVFPAESPLKPQGAPRVVEKMSTSEADDLVSLLKKGISARREQGSREMSPEVQRQERAVVSKDENKTEAEDVDFHESEISKKAKKFGAVASKMQKLSAGGKIAKPKVLSSSFSSTSNSPKPVLSGATYDEDDLWGDDFISSEDEKVSYDLREIKSKMADFAKTIA